MFLIKLTVVGLSIVLLGCAQDAQESPVGSADAVEWQEYTSEEGGFQVKTPGTPRRTEEGGYQIHEVVLREEGIGYFVHYADLPPVLDSIPADAKLKTYEDKTIKKDYPTGEIVQTNELQLGDHPGKEFILAVDGDNVIRRVYMTDRRMFLVTVSGRNISPSSPNVAPFLESFTILR